jgi:hypothetical protein
MIYPAKRDWWITGLLLVPGCFLVADSLFLAGVALQLNRGYALLLVPALFLVVGLVLLWVVFGTSYEITADALRVRFGPFRWTVPLRSVVEVHSSRTFGSVVGWGLALSLDRLLVRYRKGNGRMAFGVRISPQDKAAFVRELQEKAPGFCVSGDPL